MLNIKVWVTATAVSLAGFIGSASADVLVHGFGDNGWYSSDTRSATGGNLFGADNTHPYIISQVGNSVPGDDAIIADQIQFVHGPAGSLNDNGAVRLYATNNNNGKAHLSVLNPAGFADGSALADPGFFFDYRYYNEPLPIPQTLGVSIAVSDGVFTYNFAYFDPSSTRDSWNDIQLSANTGEWWLYDQNGIAVRGRRGGGGFAMTLADWADSETYGHLLSSSSSIVEIGFNLGTWQKRNASYVDWLQTSVLEGGDLIDFQAAHLPEPGSLALLGIGSGLLLARGRRRNT